MNPRTTPSRPLRQKRREVTDRRIIDGILARAAVCRLAMIDRGEPYVVPVNYGYRDNALYIHSAPVGRKIEALRRRPRVCFEIEGPVRVVPHAKPCRWNAKARSIIGYGRVEILTDPREKRRGLDIIMAHHGRTGANRYGKTPLAAMVLLRVAIESLCCKQVGSWTVPATRPPAPRA